MQLLTDNLSFSVIDTHAHSYHSFGPLSFCLSVNYLDRFLSTRELPRQNAWAVQLLAVACLSIAAKIEETSVPQLIDLQVGDPKFVFEAKTIQRMELVVLGTLNWKMNAITPCSFLYHIQKKLSDVDHDKTLSSISTTINVMNRSMQQLIVSSIRGIDFLVFKPSEIAVAVAISVSAEYRAMDIDNAVSYFTHLEKEKVLKCIEMISNLGSGQGVAESPIGVLDAACFSYKNDESTTIITVAGGSSANSCGIPEAKRQKYETSSTSGLDS